MSVLHHLALQCEALVILLQETHCTSVERLDLPSYHLAGFSLSRKHGLATFVHERLKWILIDQSPPTSEIEWVCVDVDNYKIVNVYKPLQHGCKHLIFQHSPIPASMLATSTATMLTGAIIITIQMVNAWLAGPVPTTSPCYIAPRRPPVSTLAAGKQTPTQILHLPASIWTVTNLITYLRKVPKVTTPTLAYKSTQTCSSTTEQACKAMKLSQGQLGPLF